MCKTARCITRSPSSRRLRRRSDRAETPYRMLRPASVSPGITTCSSSAGASDAKDEVDNIDVVDATEDSDGERELARGPWPPLVRPASARPRASAASSTASPRPLSAKFSATPMRASVGSTSSKSFIFIRPHTSCHPTALVADVADRAAAATTKAQLKYERAARLAILFNCAYRCDDVTGTENIIGRNPCSI